MKLSEEEIKEIDRELKVVEELQLKNGNKTYTMEEAWNIIQKEIGGNKKWSTMQREIENEVSKLLGERQFII